MNCRRPFSLLMVAFLLGGAVVLPGAADGARRRARRPCYDCHAAAKEAFARKYVHAPVAKEDCEVCHKRHGFSQKLVLQASPPELCTPCHEDVVAGEGSASNHLAVDGVTCVSCHDPHASDSPGLMRGTEEETCAGCHPRLQALGKDAARHRPFAEGTCDACHAPHASPQPGLLLAPEDSLCARCHGPVSDLPEPHARPEVAGASCSSCHDPHGTAKTGGRFIHEPYAAGDCDACHEDVLGDPEALTDTREALCLDCHDDVA